MNKVTLSQAQEVESGLGRMVYNPDNLQIITCGKSLEVEKTDYTKLNTIFAKYVAKVPNYVSHTSFPNYDDVKAELDAQNAPVE